PRASSRGAPLAPPRGTDTLRAAVGAMRQRMRAELDRSGPGRFDLKQGEGGLVDLEFLLQALVLQHAPTRPDWAVPGDTPSLLRELGAAGWLPDPEALANAHAQLVGLGLECTLDQRPRLVPPGEALAQAREAVLAACARAGLSFSVPAAAAGS